MNVYEIVNDRVIKMLEAGTVPWHKPWAEVGAPRNLVSKKPYRGINVFLLSATKYVQPWWLSYKQATDLGGYVRKGEESSIVVFWKVDAIEDPDKQEGEISSADKSRMVLRYYRVFNVEQCDLPEKVLAKLPAIETREHEPIDEAQVIYDSYPERPAITREGGKAYYSPASDTVNLPAHALFESAEEFYSTAFHEFTHSTGHPKRLARDSFKEPSHFGSAICSREELVAEMGSAYLCAEAGISTAVIENQAAYIQGWLLKLRSDSRLVVIAAAQAQKAADHIMNRKFER